MVRRVGVKCIVSGVGRSVNSCISWLGGGTQFLLSASQESLAKLKSDLIEREPMLDGLSLLFKDYEPQYWW